ncbi:hypothetical protein ACFLUW_00425 [Chloroflexota bacterium]
MLRAIMPGIKMSVTGPFSAPHLSVRVVSGHYQSFRIKAPPSINMLNMTTSKNQLKVAVAPA